MPVTTDGARDTTPRPRALLVEDDADLRLTTRLVLERHGFTVAVAVDGVDALEQLDHPETPCAADVAVIDVMMPRMDGLTPTRRLRASARHADLPIVLLTARDLIHDQVAGLDAGADDYVVKPFDGDVLAARLRALLRRRPAPASAEPDLVTVADLSIDLDGMVVTRDGVPIELTATEFRLLSTLLEHRGAVLSRDQLLDRVWGGTSWTTSRAVDVNIQRLRAKVGHEIVTTVRGAGYKVPRR